MYINKSTTNGVRGEKRTESILVDGFSILKRYEDYDGADFHVQERGLDSDRSAWYLTNLAVIQSKYIESNNPIKINKHYILDQRAAYPDITTFFTCFFVMIHTGDIDNEEAYMLSAQDIYDLWKNDGEIIGDSVSVKKVTLTKDQFCFYLPHIKDIAANQGRGDMILRKDGQSFIQKNCYDRIKTALRYKEGTQRGINTQIVKVETGDADFDKRYLELREQAAMFSGNVIGAARRTFETLLTYSEELVKEYKVGEKGTLIYLEEVLKELKLAFGKFETVNHADNEFREEFFLDFEKFLADYNRK